MATETFTAKKERLRRADVDSNPALKDRYRDFHSSFAVHPIKKDLSIKTDVEAIKQSVRNLILTDRGERPFQPTIGSRIKQMLFENYTPQTGIMIKQFVQETIRNHEPRARLIETNVSPYPDLNGIHVEIVFSVINIDEPITLELILERIR